MNLDPLIVALDVDSLAEARRWVRLLKAKVKYFKIGPVLFTAAGPEAVKVVHDEGGKVFLDLKFYDIPNTVAKACEAAAKLGVFMITVHAQGGGEMLRAAAKAVKSTSPSPLLIGVTVLTSEGGGGALETRVVDLAASCQSAGLNGVVCSANEIETVRHRCGKDFVIVTPGIRLPASGSAGAGEIDDQKRIATPQEAIKRGADYFVIGRPILTAPDPMQVIQSIEADLEKLNRLS